MKPSLFPSSFVDQYLHLPDSDVCNVAQVRDISSAIGVALDNDLILIVIPAGAVFNIAAELVDGLGRHVAELLLSIRHEALTSSVQVRITQLSSLVLVRMALDEARVVLKALLELVVCATPLHGRGFGKLGCGVLRLAIAILWPVVDGRVVRVGVELDRRSLPAVVVQVLLGRVVSVKLRPVDLKS